MKYNKIGLMGGTFDPIHYGHLILAEHAFEKFRLDKIIFVTAAEPPHKSGMVEASSVDRFNMTAEAIANNDHFEYSDIEMNRKGPSYTIDTLKEIPRVYGGDVIVYLLLGADEAANFMKWREPQGIMNRSTVVVANRPGFPIRDTLLKLPSDVADRVKILEMPGVDISSTDIRKRVKEGKSIKYLTPDGVIKYILDNNVYGSCVI
ncbi:MAG: nicotinate-nucleotide adenylyltransferase [Armatimonadota bacterium]